MEQQRQMIQRQLKELDSQEAVHVRGHGHENFVIQKKIMSRVSVIYCRVVNVRENLVFANTLYSLPREFKVLAYIKYTYL